MTREINTDFASNQATPQLCLLDLIGSDNEKASVIRSLSEPVNLRNLTKALPGTGQENLESCNGPTPNPPGPSEGPLPPLGIRNSDNSRTTPATTSPKPGDHNSGTVPKPSDRKPDPAPKPSEHNAGSNQKPSDHGPAAVAGPKSGDRGPNLPTTPRTEPLKDKGDRPHGSPTGSEADMVGKVERSLRAKNVEAPLKELNDLAKKLGVKPEVLNIEKVKGALEYITEKTAKIQKAIFEGDLKGLQKSIDGMSEDDLKVSAGMIRKNLDDLGVHLSIGVVNGQLAIGAPGREITSFISSSRAGALNLNTGEQSDVGEEMKQLVRSLHSAMANPFQRHYPTPIPGK